MLSSKYSADSVRQRLKYDSLAGRHLELQQEYETLLKDFKNQQRVSRAARNAPKVCTAAVITPCVRNMRSLGLLSTSKAAWSRLKLAFAFIVFRGWAVAPERNVEHSLTGCLVFCFHDACPPYGAHLNSSKREVFFHIPRSSLRARIYLPRASLCLRSTPLPTGNTCFRHPKRRAARAIRCWVPSRTPSKWRNSRPTSTSATSRRASARTYAR